ncbi:MAG TPA: ubiquitin-like domain-containing protein [Bacillales bacterium]|nr:ubiquitin-like domain-containing protein [Bacillales bacterium]
MSPILKLFSGNGKKWLMAVISFAVLSVAVGVLAYELTKKPVTVILDGEKQQLSAHAETVGELLRELGVEVGKHDIVKPGLQEELEANMTVSWLPAVQIQLSKANKEKSTWTTADTVGEFLRANKINVGEHDKLAPSPDTAIKEGMTITYLPGYQVSLNIAGKKEVVWTTAAPSISVREFLNNRNIKYDGDDKIAPGLDTPVKKTASITVTRMKTEKVTDVVPVDYAVVTKKDSSLPKGEEKVLRSGEKGKIEKTYLVTFKNGKEVSRKLIQTDTIKESKDRVVAVGTRTYSRPSRGGSDDGGSDGVVRQFYAHSTAYTANCGGCSGITATGIDLRANPDAKVIAVDPDVIPLGTRVWVEGYGYAVAADTGGAVNGRTIDVFFSTRSEAYAWGQRTVLVKILE